MAARHRKVEKKSDLPQDVEELKKLAAQEEATRAANRETLRGGDFSGGHIQGPHITP